MFLFQVLSQYKLVLVVWLKLLQAQRLEEMEEQLPSLQLQELLFLHLAVAAVPR
jgi:hypothetical protein